MSRGISIAGYACLSAGLLASLSACSGENLPSDHNGGGSGLGDGGTSGQAGADGSATGDIGYITCETANIQGYCEMTTATIFRIDPTAMTCTFVVLTPAGASCPSCAMMIGNSWCFSMGGFSNDVATCDAFRIPPDAVMATGATGFFGTYQSDPASPGGAAITLGSFDLTLTFPADAGAPTSAQLMESGTFVGTVVPPDVCGPSS